MTDTAVNHPDLDDYKRTALKELINDLHKMANNQPAGTTGRIKRRILLSLKSECQQSLEDL